MLLFLFACICFAQEEDLFYVTYDTNGFRVWESVDDPSELETDDPPTKSKNQAGFYKFDVNDFYDAGDNNWPQTEFKVKPGEKVYVNYNVPEDSTLYQKVAFKPQDFSTENTATRFIFEIKGTRKALDFGIYTDTDRSEYVNPMTLRMAPCETTGCSAEMWFGLENDPTGTDFTKKILLNLEYVLKDGSDALNEGYQWVKIRNVDDVEITSIKFNRQITFTEPKPLSIESKKDFTYEIPIDQTAGTKCTIKTNDQPWETNYYGTTLMCTGVSLFTREEDATNVGPGNGGEDGEDDGNGNKEPIKCDSSKHLEANKEGTECVCMKDYEKKGDKCEKKDSGAFSTFILTVLAIVFFLF